MGAIGRSVPIQGVAQARRMMEMGHAAMPGPIKVRDQTNYESRSRERPRAAPSRPGWTNPVPPEADATSETRLPFVPQVSSVQDLTTVSQDTTMYASMFEPLNRSLETFITKLSSQPREERGQEGH